MKIAFAVVIGLALAASCVYAEVDITEVMETVSMNGIIIDNMCAGSHGPDKLADFVKTHTKGCALMPQCEASGYSLYTDGKLMKFDNAGNEKVIEFLKKPDSKLAVTVVTQDYTEPVEVLEIRNQE